MTFCGGGGIGKDGAEAGVASTSATDFVKS